MVEEDELSSDDDLFKIEMPPCLKVETGPGERVSRMSHGETESPSFTLNHQRGDIIYISPDSEIDKDQISLEQAIENFPLQFNNPQQSKPI